MKGKNLITVEQLKEKMKAGKKLLVFGVSKNSKVYMDSMRYLDLEVSFILDNDVSRKGIQIEGVKILNPDDIEDYSGYIIVIACAYYAEIYDQLEKMGVKDVYELVDINASSDYKTLSRDAELIKRYPNIGGEDVFVYVADGFGDNIIKFPVLERLSKQPNVDKYYFLTDRQANYDLYSALFKNVEIYDKSIIETDAEYHEKILTKILRHSFGRKLCFCPTPYFHTHFDPFGERNTNIPKHDCFYQCVEWKNGRVQGSAPEGLQRMAENFFGWDDFDLSKKGAFSNVLKGVDIPALIEGKYITLGMGGISWEHAYQAEQIAEVAKWFLQNDYKVVLLGYGAKDEEYNQKVHYLCENSHNIIDLTSQCSAFQSLKIIEKTDLFIGLDSALAHGAYALDKKGIVLMSGNNFSRRFMHNNDPRMRYMTKDLECLGCYQCIYGKWNDQMDKRGLCFSSIAPQEILDVAQELLAI